MIRDPLQEPSKNRSVERTLQLLLALEESGRPTGLSELARSTKLPKATVQRLLSVLEKYGFTEKWQGKYHLGCIVLPLANAFLMNKELIRIALPVMQELAQTSEETASLFLRSGFHRIMLLRVEGLHPLRYVMPIGHRFPLHIGMGKILVPSMTDDEIQQMLNRVGEIKLASGDGLSRKAFLDQVGLIQKQGYFISRNERMIGAASVSAPIVDANGKIIAAVSVSGSSDRLTLDKLEKLSTEVRAAANAVAERYHAD